ARPLRGSLADLEALLGHAVVLTDKALHAHWRVPEQAFAACVCVPVASANMPLGTLWLFAREPREFSDSQTNIIEVVAGRLAADLERQLLADEARRARTGPRELAKLTAVSDVAEIPTEDATARSLRHVPTTAPLVEGWQVAAKMHDAPTGGLFYD